VTEHKKDQQITSQRLGGIHSRVTELELQMKSLNLRANSSPGFSSPSSAIQDIICNILQVNKEHGRGMDHKEIRDQLQGFGCKNVTKKEVNQCLYKLEAEGQVKIVGLSGVKPLWAVCETSKRPRGSQ